MPIRPASRTFPLLLLLALAAPAAILAQSDTVHTSCTLLIDRDTFVKQGDPDDNDGSSRFLRIGPETSAGAANVFRIFLAADLSDGCTETGLPLPVDAVLEAAYLRLFTNNGPGRELQHDVARVVPAGIWAEGTLTWNNQPAVDATPTDGRRPATMRNRWLMEWDVTADVALFLTGTANNGWRIAIEQRRPTTRTDAAANTCRGTTPPTSTTPCPIRAC